MAYNDVNTGSVSSVKNTGAKSTHIEGKLKLPLISNGYQYDNIAAYKTFAALRAQIVAKTVVPLYEAFALADASTEDEKFEQGSFSFVTKKGVDKITYECYITLQAYLALKSFEGSAYNELHEITDKGELIGNYATDGVKVKGRAISSLLVTRTRSVDEKMAYVKVEINFADKDDVSDAVITTGDYDDTDVLRIHDLKYTIVSASSTELIVDVATDIGGVYPPSALAVADFVFTKDSDGAAQTLTLDSEVTGRYTFSGTGLVTGKLNSNGVLDESTILYEGIEEQVTI